MNVKELIQLRLLNQRLASTEFERPVDVVSHFGAMQSQDYAMAKWAVGMRTQNPSDLAIEACVNSGDIIRTHILRPTWHFVNRKDVRWMMTLSAPYVKKATQYVDAQVGLTDEIFKKIWKKIEIELQLEDNLTKKDLMNRLAKRKIRIEGLMATQVLIRAELEMHVCSGVRHENKVTYSLFDARIPRSEKISKKDSIVKLASLYFNSRGPATIKDFMWWSGLSLSESKFGVSALGKNLKCASLGGLDYLYVENAYDQKKKISALLPSYDEYMVSYAEGRNIALPANVDKSVLGNGIFKPMVLSDNTIVGTWKKINQEPFLDIQFLSDGRHRNINSKIVAFKQYWGKQKK